MEGLLNKAEFLIDKYHETLIRGGCGDLLGQPLYRKLAEVYTEEAEKVSRLKSISLTHQLLEKLVKRDNLNCLVVNLYRGNEGFSLVMRLSSGVETETVRLQYEDEEFFSYIDYEQLPPMLLDLVDEANIDIFYSGCIIAEIRDYRRSLDSNYESKYILLKPTNQSLVADVAALTRDKEWTPLEKLQLEAEIVKRTAPSLNLLPSPRVALIKNKLHHHRYKFSGIPLRRAARKFCQVAQNRQKKFEENGSPSLRLFGFLADRKDKRTMSRNAKPTIPMTTDDLSPTISCDGKDKFYQKVTDDVREVAKPLDRVQDTMDNSLVIVEEYTLETERGQGRIYLTKLTLSQRRTDEVYFGELYVDRDYQEGKQNGSICRFQLGTLYQVQRYVKQFKEILTEEGRKNVKITHTVPGQPPRVVHTPGSRDKKDIIAEQLKQQQEQQAIQVKQSDGTLKKTLNVLTKPITVTSAASLSSLLSAQSSPQQSVGQQLVVGQSVNLTSLLNSRQIVNRAVNVTAIASTAVTVTGPITQATKVAVNVSSAAAKLSMPTLAAQLNRPAPTYSQAVTATKTQSFCQIGAVSDATLLPHTKSGNVTPTANPNSNLQALLAGSSAEDSTISRNATLLERLTAQSVMLNTSKIQEDSGSKISSSSTNMTTSISTATSNSTVLRATEGGASGPPNISLANIANLPGLNVGLQTLPTNIPSIQNVHLSLPGFPVPLSLSLNVPGSSSSNSGSTIIVTSPSALNVVSKTCGTTSVTSSSATVMIASPPGLQQRHVVQLPLSQLNGSQLAAQLTKTNSQGSAGSSNIPVLQGLATSTGEIALGSISTSAGPQLGSSIVTFTSKQPLAISKQPSGQLTWQLQQKLIAAKRQQQLQQQQQQIHHDQEDILPQEPPSK